MEYTYDETGRLKTFDNGFGATTYEYDLLDRVTRVIDHNGNATVYEYDALGNRSAVRYPNGTVMTYTYDACQRLKEECITDANGNLLSKYTYGLGKAGERLTITEETDGTTTEIGYTYDNLNRLVKETITREENELTNEYTYDKVSNRISKTTTVTGELSALADTDLEEIEIIEGTTTYTYNALNQMVTETTPEGTITYTYDGNGNLIQKSGRENAAYTYDVENHLLAAEVTKEGSITKETYTYDYAGNRTSKTVEEGESKDTTYYVTETSGSLSQVVAETDEEGKVTAFYTLGEDLISMERGEETWYYIYDGHGSVRHLVDSNGSLTDSYTYDAYGNLLEKEGTTENDFLYAGEQYNAGTGLYYLRARYMDPSTGTFISMDSYQGSIYDPVSLHKYLYANANPVMYTDPSGYSADTTLFGVNVKMVASNLLSASCNIVLKSLWGAFGGGVLGAIDSALAGNDFEQICNDAGEWAFYGGVFANLAEFKLFLKAAPVLGVVAGYFGIRDSLNNGHGWQALFRIGLTIPSVLASARMIKNIKLPKLDIRSNLKSLLKNNGGYLDLEVFRGKNSKITNKVYFGQKSVSPNFSPKGKFKGEPIQSVVDKLIKGELSPDDLPIEYIVRDGKMITMNNRSLTALCKANMQPTKLINVTGNPIEEAKLTGRLSEMGGKPSESIFIRIINEIVHIPH